MAFRNPFAQGPSQPTFRNPFTEDSISSIRQRQILTPQFEVDDYQPPQRDYEPSQADQYYKGYPDILNQNTPHLDAWKNYLQETPKMEDYKPGVMTRIAAALSGASAGMRDPSSGVKVANEINTGKYRNAIQDYATRGAGMKDLASMEDTDKNERVKALMAARTYGLDYQKYLADREHKEATAASGARSAEGGYMRGEAAKTDAATRAATTGGRWSDQEGGGAMWQTPSGATRTIPGKSVASGQLGVSRGNLGVSQGNLDVNRQNNALGQARFGWEIAGSPGKAPTGSPASPTAQRTAKEMAYDEFATMDKLKHLMTDDSGFWAPRADLTPAEREMIRKATELRVGEIVRGGGYR